MAPNVFAMKPKNRRDRRAAAARQRAVAYNTVTEAHVEQQLKLLQMAFSYLQTPEPARTARCGDVVTIDFAITAGGKALDAFSGSAVQLDLGSGQMLHELDDAITGHEADARLDVDVRFPEAHPNPELAGQVGVLRVHLLYVKERIVPVLDDAFAMKVGSLQTLAELRADIRNKLEELLKSRG